MAPSSPAKVCAPISAHQCPNSKRIKNSPCFWHFFGQIYNLLQPQSVPFSAHHCPKVPLNAHAFWLPFG